MPSALTGVIPKPPTPKLQRDINNRGTKEETQSKSNHVDHTKESRNEAHAWLSGDFNHFLNDPVLETFQLFLWFLLFKEVGKGKEKK